MTLTAAADTFALAADIDAGDRRNAAPAADAFAERGECWLTLPLRHAGPRTVRIGYECLGPPDAAAIAVLGGISADRHLAASKRYPEAGWWQAQIGADRALNPRRVRLIGIDWLGADGVLDAPIDSADQADALAAVLDALGVRQLHALIGASYGAMVGLAFAARHGQRLRRLLAISGGHRPHPYASAWRSVQRAIVRLGGDAPPRRRAALAVARQLAMLSYRTPEEFAERFGTGPALHDDRCEVAAESYLRACGERFADRFDATAFLRLSESIDLHQVDPSSISVPTTVVAVADDRLVPIADLYDLVERLAGPARLIALRSRYGHDAFLKETDAIDDAIRSVVGAGGTETAA